MNVENPHPVFVVSVQLTKHPNADALSLVRVDGFQVIVRTEDWNGVDKGAYVPPDSVLPCGLVEGVERVRARKFRGLYSEGILLPAPEGSRVGDDVAEQMGVTHWEPVPEVRGSETSSPPSHGGPVYKLENARSSSSIWPNGCDLVITEKIHGQNWRAMWDGERFHVGSRTIWKKEGDGANLWWSCLSMQIKALLKAYPLHTIYGEQYGMVGKFPYDVPKGSRSVRVFDISHGRTFLGYHDLEELCSKYGVPMAPVLAIVPWAGDLELLNPYAEGKTTLGGKHIREGAVIRPVEEGEFERHVLKLVGRGYMAKG